MKKIIILDRDGVINADSKEYIKSPLEWIPLAGSLEAIACLNTAGYTVLVATNQSGIARGFYDIAMLDKIHEKMHASLAAVGGKIEHIFYCPHGPQDECICRKPKPGLLQQIAATYGVSLSTIYYVGDSLRDIEAAQNAGAIPILVLTGNGQQTLQKHAAKLKTIAHYDSLASFTHTLTSSIVC